MKNFIEIETEEGKKTININHILKISPIQESENEDKCIISYNISQPNTEGYLLVENVKESYRRIINKINLSIK